MIYIHLVFSTKNRKPFLSDRALRNDMHAYLAGSLKKTKCVPVQVGGPEDHIHALFELTRVLDIAELTREIKRASSVWAKEKSPTWRDFEWQSGYAAFSVSHSLTPKVKKYIETQEEHHKKSSYQDEFISLLKHHNITYDERYLWD